MDMPRGPAPAAPRAPYNTVEAATLAGCTYRQLDYWLRTGALAALDTGTHARGSGSRRRFTHHDVQVAAVCARLAALGVEGPLLQEAVYRAADLPHLQGRLCVYPSGVVTHDEPPVGHCWVVDLDAVWVAGADPTRAMAVAV